MYKEKIERSFHENNPKTAWKTLQKVTGYKRKSCIPESIVCQTFVDNLNEFYCRFDQTDFSRENTEVIRNLKENSFDGFSCINLSEHDVRRVLGNVIVSKAPGPDHICNKVLKTCKDQLAGVFQRLFQLSIDQGAIPKLWKTSIIVPLPKVKNPN